MPNRCVVFGCSNESNLKEGVALHAVPFANDDRPEAKKRKKRWVDFVQKKMREWTPRHHRFVQIILLKMIL